MENLQTMDVTPMPSAGRERAAEGLRAAIAAAKRAGLISGDEDLAAHMGFVRPNVSQHRHGKRPMSRETVLQYAEILQCDPMEIADDEVRMQLQQDLERYHDDAERYVKIAEYVPTSAAPIKYLANDLIGANAAPGDLVTVRMDSRDSRDSRDSITYGDVATCKRLPPGVVESGKLHALDDNGRLYTATVQAENGGIIISPANGLPSFKTFDQLTDDGITIIGVVLVYTQRLF